MLAYGKFKNSIDLLIIVIFNIYLFIYFIALFSDCVGLAVNSIFVAVDTALFVTCAQAICHVRAL